MPLDRALLGAKAAGSETLLGRECAIFRFEKVGPSDRPQTLTYSIDAGSGVPLKVAAYRDEGHVASKRPNWTWEALSTRADGPFVVQDDSAYRSFFYATDPGGREVVTMGVEKQTRVVKAEFNAALEDSLFWPALPPGTHVFDNVKNTETVVPGGAAREEAKTVASPPLRAGEPGGSFPYASCFGLVLGFSCLIAAYRIRRKG